MLNKLFKVPHGWEQLSCSFNRFLLIILVVSMLAKVLEHVIDLVAHLLLDTFSVQCNVLGFKTLEQAAAISGKVT